LKCFTTVSNLAQVCSLTIVPYTMESGKHLRTTSLRALTAAWLNFVQEKSRLRS